VPAWWILPRTPGSLIGLIRGLKTAAFSTHLAAGLTYKLATNTSAYLYYSRSLNTVNLADKPNGTLVNPVHSSEIWSLGLSHSF
jgi:hypothetical protein